jgi:hypothetical protein
MPIVEEATINKGQVARQIRRSRQGRIA